MNTFWLPKINYFNPRSPRGGATSKTSSSPIKLCIFQSTLPTRGSDVTKTIHRAAEQYFNPRSPRGGATLSSINYQPTYEFQSTLPTRGSDIYFPPFLQELVIFQSTLPTRGSDGAVPEDKADKNISIHAPHEGERHKWLIYRYDCGNFNPRSPRGGATAEKCICMQHFREFAEYYPLRHGDAR